MSHDKELEIRRQFLDEAKEYLDTLDSAVLGLSNGRVDIQKINAALRAAHSIKGGAGMMGFQLLSHLAHRLEDSFKALKTQKHSVEIDAALENRLLMAVSCLRHVIECDRQGFMINPRWIATEADPIFDQLHDELGDPQPEDANSVLAPEEGQDIIPILFETEVEGCLQRLESVLSHPEKPCLQEEVTILAQELGGLGEMLQLSAFSGLCESVLQAMESHPDAIESIADAALQAWRHTQVLVLTGQLDQIPAAIEVPGIAPFAEDAFVGSAFEGAFDDANVTIDLPIGQPGERQESWQEETWPQENWTEESWPQETWQEETWQEETWPQENWTEEPAPIVAESEVVVDSEVFVESESVVVPEEEPAWELSTAQAPPQAEPSVRETRVTDFKVLEVKPESSASTPVEEDQDATVRVSVRQLNHLNDLFGELTIERNGLDLYLKRLRTLTQTLLQRVQLLDQSNDEMRSAYDRVTPRTTSQSMPMLAAAGHSDTSFATPYSTSSRFAAVGEDSQGIRSGFDVLEMDQYTELHLMSQQVMETIVQVQEVTSDIELSLDETEQTARELNKTAKQLQTSLTHIRMRPLSDIADRFPRALREMCLQHGKKARLAVSGGGTLIDRNILEALNDPLMHLLRNAFDHGIEGPEARKAQGKSEEGVIEIRAVHRGNRTLITISDDGKGIQLDKIRAKAEQMGLDPTLLAAASDEELLSLIFEPGFSTTDQVTSLSGRGVGMDVVRDSLRQIRGEITVQTQEGVGTTFTLSVPFTLSVVQALLVESDGMLLAFPTDVVEEMLLLQPEDVITTAGSEVLNLQEKLVQFVRLSHWLKFNCPRQPHALETPPTINAQAVLIVSHSNQPVALQVDRCWGEQEVAVRRVEGNLPLPPGFTSCTILGDGRVVPLVNISDFLHWIASRDNASSSTPAPAVFAAPIPIPSQLPPAAQQLRLEPALPTVPKSLPVAQSSTVLIVDDSINVRRFLALTLERAGYRVEQAKDGQDALEKLQRGLAVQAVICDIEMPRLDGYGFLAKAKADTALQDLPIAMLTSRSGDKHRQLAMSLGASAYFSKPYNEQVLLRTLEQLIQTGVAV